MNLEEILLKMFWCLETNDLETYGQLREIMLQMIQEKNREIFLH